MDASALKFLSIGAAAAVVGACSVAIGDFEECRVQADCASGLLCVDNLCVSQDGGPPPICTSSDECRVALGYGAVCEATGCVVAPKSERCALTEPPDLAGALGTAGVTGRVLLGAMFKLQAPKELARAHAAQLAVREMNEEGGIVGVPVGLVVCDNDLDNDPANDEQESEDATRYLADSLGVRLVVGPSSSANATAAVNTLLTGRLPTSIVSPSATSSTLTNLVDRFDPATDPHGLFWRTCPSDSLQGRVLATTIAETLAEVTDRVLVAYQRDSYGQGLEETFRAEFLALDADHQVTSRSFEVDESDLAEAVAGLAAVGSAGALLIVSGDANRTVHVLEEASASSLVDLPVFLTDGSKDAQVLLSRANPSGVKAMLLGARGTAPARPSGLAYDTFANNLQTVFGVDPAEFSFVAQSYDATYAGVFALAFATRSSEPYDGFKVAEGLAQLTAGQKVNAGPTGFTTGVSELRGRAARIDLEGTSGPLDFDPTTGEAPGPIEVWQVNPDGTAFVTVSVVTP